jgi:hypothetical protein
VYLHAGRSADHTPPLEDIEAAEDGRPWRRYYRPGSEGADRACAALDPVHIPVPAPAGAPKSQLIPA